MKKVLGLLICGVGTVLIIGLAILHCFIKMASFISLIITEGAR